MVDYGRLIRDVLREHGWRFQRQGKGDHEIWIDPQTGRTVSIDAGSKSRHLSNEILKAIGLGERF